MLKKGLGGIIFLLLLIAGPGYSQSIDTVLIISIDALRPDALEKGTTPVLGGLMKQGTFTLKGMSVDPPKTLIAHTAMFTGLEPSANGKTDNGWKPGEQRVTLPTVFDTAKRLAYRTAFFYSKPKLGYLVNGAIDEQGLAPDDGVDRARAFISKRGRTFVVLHLSGLEYDGMENGWLSKQYLETFAEIDRALAPLFDDIRKQGRYLIIVTSDHGGHDRLHGTSHPDDFRVPLIIASDRAKIPDLRDSYRITGLKGIVEKMLSIASAAGRSAKK